MDTARYIFAVLVVSWLPPALVWWFVVHPFTDFWRGVGVRKTYWILGIGMALSIGALTWFRDSFVGSDLGTNVALLVLAGALFIVSARVAFARKKHLTFRILAGVPELEAEPSDPKLLNEGIYAKMRHPRYVEVVLGTLAYAAFANHTGSWLVALATIPTVHLIVLLEERELIERFGDRYRQYAAEVPRYLPKRSA